MDVLILDMKNSIEFIMERMNLYEEDPILMGLNSSGRMPKEGFEGSMEYKKNNALSMYKETAFRLNYRKENIHDMLPSLL